MKIANCKLKIIKHFFNCQFSNRLINQFFTRGKNINKLLNLFSPPGGGDAGYLIVFVFKAHQDYPLSISS